jgi:hypothetical protein
MIVMIAGGYRVRQAHVPAYRWVAAHDAIVSENLLVPEDDLQRQWTAPQKSQNDELRYLQNVQEHNVVALREEADRRRATHPRDDNPRDISAAAAAGSGVRPLDLRRGPLGGRDSGAGSIKHDRLGAPGANGITPRLGSQMPWMAGIGRVPQIPDDDWPALDADPGAVAQFVDIEGLLAVEVPKVKFTGLTQNSRVDL